MIASYLINSVYTAEIMTVTLCLQWVEEVRPDRDVSCVDSLAVLLSTQSMKSNRKDFVLEIQQSLQRQHRRGVEVQLFWVPAHVCIKGNEGADKVAKKLKRIHK